MSRSNLNYDRERKQDILLRNKRYDLRLVFDDRLRIDYNNSILQKPDKVVEIQPKTNCNRIEIPSAIDFGVGRCRFENLDSFSVKLTEKKVMYGSRFVLLLGMEDSTSRQCSKFSSASNNDATALIRELMGFSWKPFAYSTHGKISVNLSHPKDVYSDNILQLYVDSMLMIS